MLGESGELARLARAVGGVDIERAVLFAHVVVALAVGCPYGVDIVAVE